ncbi:MAG: class I SAM-dependent methyltransferase [Ilumatobacter sp.]
MSATEFGDQAASIAIQITELPTEEQIAVACRGSGNPVALTWLAENLRLRDTSTVVDLGAGIGGPSAWLRSRYGCRITGVEPEEQAAQAASSIFGLTTIVAAAEITPFAADTFDSALLLGVVSVVPGPETVLREARRIARTLGLLDYCSTSNDPVVAGGSTFPTPQRLRAIIAVDWRINQFAAVDVDPPDTWAHAGAGVESKPDPDEAEVVRAIESRSIAPVMLMASR